MLALRTENRWLERGHKFFRTLARNGLLRSALFNRGLTTEELRHGWELFSAALGPGRETPQMKLAPMQTANAGARLEAWDAPTYAATQATLEHRTPAACAYLMHGLTHDDGPSAVIAVEHFLDRVVALRAGTAPSVSLAEGALAVRLLEERKIMSGAIESELREWIAQAKFGVEPVFPPPADAAAAAETAFIEYRNWLNEWREIARTTFTQRRHLIALGLAARRDRDELVPVTSVESAPLSRHPAL
jgi:hypothetical protein